MVIGTMTNLNLRVYRRLKSDDPNQSDMGKTILLKHLWTLVTLKTYDELKEKLNRVLTGSRITGAVDNVDIPHWRSTTSYKCNR